MKTTMSLLSLVAASCLGWRYHATDEAKTGAESRFAEVTRQMDGLRQELSAARSQYQSVNARLVALNAAQSGKTNWVEERNRNWQSSLGRGAYDNKKAVTIVPSPIIIVSPTTSGTSSAFAPARQPLPAAPVPHLALPRSTPPPLPPPPPRP